MISFGPTEEQEVVREAMREFGQQALRPVARECDEAEGVSEELLQQSWELGLTSTQLPEEQGGGGEARSPVTNAILLEELAYGDPSLALAAASPGLVAYPVADFGTPAQRERWLPLFTGERFPKAALAWAEPAPDFDPAAPRTTAEPKGEAFVLSGRKTFVPLGDRAEHFLVLARNTTGEGEGLAGLEAFWVPREAAGLTVEGPERNLGLRAVPTARLALERVEVPAGDRLGEGRGFDGRRLLASTRTAGAAVMVGLARAVLDYAVPYAKERYAFGEAIAQKQAIAFMLASMKTESEAMRWLTWKAASRLEQGLDAARSAAFAYRYAAEQCMKIADDGLQVLGGHGYIREHPVEMWYRNARTLSVLETLAAA